MEKIGFTKACNDFFGRKSNQTLQEFNVELKDFKSVPGNAEYLVAEFAKIGINVASPERLA